MDFLLLINGKRAGRTNNQLWKYKHHVKPLKGETFLSLESCNRRSFFSGLSIFYLYMSKLCYITSSFKNCILYPLSILCSHLFCAFDSHNGKKKKKTPNSFLGFLFYAYLLSSCFFAFLSRYKICLSD